MKKYFVATLFLLIATFAWNADWPQYRGANRDGASKETILKSWPAEGPAVLWKSPIGDGYSALSITGNRIYTMDAKGADEFIVCLDATNGKEVWRYRTDANFSNDQGNGP